MEPARVAHGKLVGLAFRQRRAAARGDVGTPALDWPHAGSSLLERDRPREEDRIGTALRLRIGRPLVKGSVPDEAKRLPLLLVRRDPVRPGGRDWSRTHVASRCRRRYRGG